VLLVGLMALAAWKGHTGDAIWWGAREFAGFVLHPLVLLYLLSGSLMISKTIHIPKL
jgi:CDP-diacylglycerol--serine O-phosphatidyltransferase